MKLIQILSRCYKQQCQLKYTHFQSKMKESANVMLDFRSISKLANVKRKFAVYSTNKTVQGEFIITRERIAFVQLRIFMLLLGVTYTRSYYNRLTIFRLRSLNMIGKFFVVGRSDGNVLWLCRTSQHIESGSLLMRLFINTVTVCSLTRAHKSIVNNNASGQRTTFFHLRKQAMKEYDQAYPIIHDDIWQLQQYQPTTYITF